MNTEDIFRIGKYCTGQLYRRPEVKTITGKLWLFYIREHQVQCFIKRIQLSFMYPIDVH